MKKLFTVLIVISIFSFINQISFGQDSLKTSGVKHINATSEQTDKLYGRKIQQQSLSLNSFEKTNAVNQDDVKVKSCSKCRHKHFKAGN